MQSHIHGMQTEWMYGLHLDDMANKGEYATSSTQSQMNSIATSDYFYMAPESVERPVIGQKV